MTPNVDIRLHARDQSSNQCAVSTCCMAFASPSRWTTTWPDSRVSKNRFSNICEQMCRSW